MIARPSLKLNNTTTTIINNTFLCRAAYAVIITLLTYYNLLPITLPVLFISSCCVIIAGVSAPLPRSTCN